MKFVQTTGQAIYMTSYWLKLEHCSNANLRSHGPIFAASMFVII